MRRSSVAGALFAFVLVLGVRPVFADDDDDVNNAACAAATQANATATDAVQAPLDPAALQAQIDALADRLANIQARLEDVGPGIGDAVDQIRQGKYGGSTDPAISGDVDALFKDAEGFGAASKNGSVLFMKLNLDMIETLPDSSVIHIDFGPAFSPGQNLEPWNVDDPDEEHVGLGTATRLGTLMATFSASVKKDSFQVTAGTQAFSLSPFSVSGQYSSLPYLFDMNVYRDSSTSMSYFDSQFLTGVHPPDPTASQHPIMGVTTNLGLTDQLSVMAFLGNFQNYYLDSTMPHEYGGDITLDKKDSWGGVYHVIGYNHSNDSGEILAADGSLEGYYGLMNNTVFSFDGQQKVGRVDTDFEVANSDFDDSSGAGFAPNSAGQYWGGVHADAQAWRLDTETHLGDQILRLGIYGLAPNYLVTDPEGYYNNDDSNLPRYRPNPNQPGGIIPETVVADPTLPMDDTITYHVETQLRAGDAFLKLRLQNSFQTQASDAQIWASHYEGGSNMGEGTWFVFFNNNYTSWLPPDAYQYGTNSSAPTPSAAAGINPYLERQFSYNTNNGPTTAFPTTELLNNYNNTYAPSNNGPSTEANPAGAIHDVNNQYLYNSYHDLETDDLWRSNMEGVVNSTPQGLADAPSIKYISNGTADMRMNLADYLPLGGHALFWQTFGEILTVDDSGIYAPSLDPDNLFVQSVADSTLIYNLTPSVDLLLNLGIEDWATNRIATSFVNEDGNEQNATLEYHDREAGAGMDWNFIPNKLNLYFRVKLLDHEDSFASENNFQARQLWFQMRSFF
jgi:hypothetical protein